MFRNIKKHFFDTSTYSNDFSSFDGNMKNIDEIKYVEKLYNKRSLRTNDAIKAAGQWQSEECVPKICDEICKKIRISKEDKVLELGCGSGVLGDRLRRESKLYVGIDISLQMLKIFSNNMRTKNIINLFQASTHTIPFINDTFDVIVMNSVTMYFPNEDIFIKTLEEIKRVAKKNATLFIGDNITPDGYFWEFTWFKNLSKPAKLLAKPYIKLRKWMAIKNSRFAGKWKYTHKEVSPEFINTYFSKNSIEQSKSATSTIKQKILGKKYQGNRRVDFVIKLGKEKDV